MLCIRSDLRLLPPRLSGAGKMPALQVGAYQIETVSHHIKGIINIVPWTERHRDSTRRSGQHTVGADASRLWGIGSR